MTRFLDPKFSVGGGASPAYAEGWERTFGQKADFTHTIAAPFEVRATSPVEAYEALLRQLHELGRRGLNDSPEADALRDKMDGPWWAMTREEHERMERLSAELGRRPCSCGHAEAEHGEHTTISDLSPCRSCACIRYSEAP